MAGQHRPVFLPPPVIRFVVAPVASSNSSRTATAGRADAERRGDEYEHEAPGPTQRVHIISLPERANYSLDVAPQTARSKPRATGRG